MGEGEARRIVSLHYRNVGYLCCTTTLALQSCWAGCQAYDGILTNRGGGEGGREGEIKGWGEVFRDVRYKRLDSLSSPWSLGCCETMALPPETRSAREGIRKGFVPRLT